MRATLALVAVVCALSANALSLRADKKGDDEQHYIVPTTVDLSGTGGDVEGKPLKTYKPKYTEFSADESEEPKDEGKTFKPKYKKMIPERAIPSVTKAFCAGVLKSIEAKEAPYYINGEFTGEMRTDMIEQCGGTICTWGVEYRKLVETCPTCPKNCDGDFDPKAFFDSLLSDSETAAPIIKAILHISGESDTKEVHIQMKKNGEADDAKKPFDAKDHPGPTKLQGSDPDVTRGFCLKVLKGVQEKKAPYYVDDKATGEARKDLIEQCADRVCGWSNSYKDFLKANTPCGAADPKKYMVTLMADGKAMSELVLYAGGDAEAKK